jgi:Kef-type K+ transport system membrane component KefB
MLGLVSFSDWLWCAVFVFVGVASKILPVYVGARGSGLARGDAMAAGILMNTRALMELVVLNIGFDLGFIPPKVFTMLVMLAVISTIMTAPLLRIARRRAGHPLMMEATSQ